MKDILSIIKVGGNIIDDESALITFLKAFADLEGRKILVHGGGKLATRMADQLGIKQQLVDGRRITDAETLKIVTMVYAGYVNKNIVAGLQANGCNAVGLSGADGNLLQAHKRIHPTIDYGFVGDLDSVNTSFIKNLLDQEHAIVIAPISHDKKGLLLNTNADTIASVIANALSSLYQVQLVYSFEKSGVLLDVENESSVINRLDRITYLDLKAKKSIFAGMIPKLDNAFAAIDQGVEKVIIGKAEELHRLISGQAGTTIVNE